MFFLIPIGHDEDSVRRLPWVTIVIAALCIAVHLFAGGREAEELAEDKAVEVLEYYLEHPYLEIHPDLADAVGGPRSEEIPGPPPATKKLEQQRLDRRTAAWLAAREGLVTWEWGLVPADFDVRDLVAYMFLHGDWMHLIGNLLFLWLAGPPLEDLWGRPFFAAFYLATGIVGGLLWTAQYADSGLPLIGASGAVAGLMGAFMVRYGKSQIRMFYFIFWPLPPIWKSGTGNSPAALMLGLWFGREALSATLFGNLTGVAFWVHVWGFAFGAGSAWLVRRYKLEERVFQPKIDAKLGDAETNPVVDEAYELRQQGRPEEAWCLLSAETGKDPDNAGACLALWDLAGQLGRQDQAAEPLLHYIDWELRQGEHDLAVGRWLELERQVPGVEPGLEQRIALAEALLAEQRDAQAAKLLATVGQLDPALPPETRVRLALAAGRSRSASAPALLEPLLADPRLPHRLREELEDLRVRIRGFGVRPAAATAPHPGPTGGTPVSPPAEAVAPLPPAPATPAVAAPLGPRGATTTPPAVVSHLGPPPPRETVAPAPIQTVPAAAPGETVAPAPIRAPEEHDLHRPLGGRRRKLEIMAAVPRRLAADKLSLDVVGQGSRVLPLGRVQAIAAAEIAEGQGRHWVVIDLLVDPLDGDRPRVRTVRLRSSDFDAGELIPWGDSQGAVAAFVDSLLISSGAPAMPDPESARGRPFRRFDTVAQYESAVLGVGSAPEAAVPPAAPVPAVEAAPASDPPPQEEAPAAPPATRSFLD